MTTSVGSLLDLLDVTEVDEGVFRGDGVETSRPRVFGGQVLGQALMAAGRTVSITRMPHSLHAYFLRPGKSNAPIEYTVSTVRDGRTFSTRSIRGSQGDRSIFQMTASFVADDLGLCHQRTPAEMTPPEDARSVVDDLDTLPDIYREWGSLDFRRVLDDTEGSLPRVGDEARAQVWMRTNDPLPDEPLLHAAVLACISDLSFLSVALLPHGISMRHEGYQVASLDHSMWFHGRARVDDWLLFDQYSPAAHRGLALVQGDTFTAPGILVASVAQQGLIRPVP